MALQPTETSRKSTMHHFAGGAFRNYKQAKLICEYNPFEFRRMYGV